jgi:hypothetical protein
MLTREATPVLHLLEINICQRGQTAACSFQKIFVEVTGFEPVTLCMPCKYSTN